MISLLRKPRDLLSVGVLHKQSFKMMVVLTYSLKMMTVSFQMVLIVFRPCTMPLYILENVERQ